MVLLFKRDHEFTSDLSFYFLLNPRVRLLEQIQSISSNKNVMEKLKLYLDSSTISYLDQQDTKERMRITQKFWDSIKNSKYQIYISDTTIEAIEKCSPGKQKVLYDFLNEVDYIQLHSTENVTTLAQKIINQDILPSKSVIDSYHIAYALENDCDFILSWNFKNLVNTRARNKVRNLSQIFGLKAPDLVSPEEFYESELKMSNSNITLTADEIIEYRKKESEKMMQMTKEERAQYVMEKSIKAQETVKKWERKWGKKK